MRRRRLVAALVLISATHACGGKKTAGPPPPVPVRVGDVRRLPVPLEVAAIGHVEAYSTVAVKSRVGGEVIQVGFREGDDVKAGALLFVIDPRPFEAALAEAKANLARDRARLSEADRTLKRYEELIRKEYITQEQYDQATANAEALKATSQADEAAIETARLNLDYCRITAPVPGRTGSLLVNRGNIVKANDDKPLVVINQVEPVYVSFAIPEGEFGEVKRRSAAGRLPVTAVPQGGKPETGSTTFLDNAVDSTTGTILVKAEFPNRDRALWPGQYVNVSLTVAVDQDAIVAPVDAIQAGQTGTHVYVVKPDQTVEIRTVVVRRNWGGWALVASGLKEGERVVTDGQLRLAPGATVTEKTDATPVPTAAAKTAEAER
ncbi:MAG TPA: efflux RND transporter periplasmic adaptor subunit [Thermoanaerobaculia bacterium]|nr:efflux RND transporter periplasmic adaptor subunit [Thermoanaerobaculia bacterium]